MPMFAKNTVPFYSVMLLSACSWRTKDLIRTKTLAYGEAVLCVYKGVLSLRLFSAFCHQMKKELQWCSVCPRPGHQVV